MRNEDLGISLTQITYFLKTKNRRNGFLPFGG